MSLIILAIQTILCWSLVVFLYRMKSKFTLIPIYAYLAILTVLMHNFSDLGFAVLWGKLFFLVASVSLFTTLMFIILFLYLFEGVRAAMMALSVILGASFFYIFLVYILQSLVDTSAWVHFDWAALQMYFWSMLAIVVDIFLLAIFWEILSKIKFLKLLYRVFIVTFFILLIDTFIFTTGVFGAKDFYLSALQGNVLVRLILSVLAAPLITLFLKSEGFNEDKRNKPRNFWEILNFHSDLESKISNLEDIIKKNKALEDKLKKASETYELVIAGSGAGIWDWDMITNQFIFSEKFLQILGYKKGQLQNHVNAFKKIIHPDDLPYYTKNMEQCLAQGVPCECEYRLKSKSGKYKWFSASGVVKYNEHKKPIRMVGSIIDINDKKESELKIQEKIEELSNLNKFMVGRELKMMELKGKISDLEKTKK